MNRARNADHAARVCEQLAYPIVTITRLYDYQTWKIHFWRNFGDAQRFVGFFLGCAFRVLIGLEGKLQSGDSSGGIRGLIMSSLLTRMESNLILKIVVGKKNHCAGLMFYKFKFSSPP